jgi:DNA polymerase I-like protein with 3'-5' exonuclease and polymerase domains
MEQRTAAVDFETYYHKTNCSVRVQGTRGYFDHPEFEAYLVSIATSDGGEFVGHPSDFDFSEIADYVWLSHNKGFDETLYHYLRAKGKIQGPAKVIWYCTADLAAYHGLPRALAPLLSKLYGVKLDKGVRDRMSGQRWDKLSPDQRAELTDYAMGDVRYLIQFWDEYSPLWPEDERSIADLTTKMQNRGLPVDAAKMDASIRTLQEKMFEMEELIPWFDRNDPKCGKTPLSATKLAAECRRLGLPVLKSRAKGDAAAEAWLEKYGEQAPFLQAMRDWNSCNTLLKKLLVFRDRTIFPEKDDPFYQDLPEELRDGETSWCPFSMKYCGAHTGRDAGGEGFNVLNFHRDTVFGINIRSHIVPPKGYKLLSADFSQIEPRVLAWLIDDQVFLDEVRQGRDPYVSFGINTLGHQGEWTHEDRQVWKVMVLQLGYQSWAETFQAAAKAKGGLDIPIDECKRLCQLYRKKNKRVVDFWKEMEKQARKASISSGGTGHWEVTLPSGRVMNYRDVTGKSELSAFVATEEGYRRSGIYGGLLVENFVQSISRDILFGAYLRLEEAGFPVVLRVYDEFLALVKEDEIDSRVPLAKSLITESPAWAPDLPIASDVKILDYYKK